MNLMTNFLIQSIGIVLLSWGIGAFLNELLRQRKVYFFLSNWVYFKADVYYKILGIKTFKSLVTKTVYRKINNQIIIHGRNISELRKIRIKMVDSEIGHTIGFLFAESIFILLGVNNVNFMILGTMINVIMNLYPVFLQQMNKNRIDQIIEKYSC